MTRKGCLFKRGNIWWAKWYSEGKCYRVSTGTSVRREAQQKLRELTAPFTLAAKADTLHMLAAKVVAVEKEIEVLGKPGARLADVWQWFSETTSRRRPRAATMRQYEFQWRRFLAWMEEHQPEAHTVESVDADTARAFATMMRRSRSGNTTNKYIQLLRMIWHVLIADERIPDSNPWAKVSRVDAPQHSRRELTIEELRKVCQNATEDLRPLLALGLYSGLRLGDCATLRWSEVDLRRGFITRIPSKSRKQKPVIIPIHDALRSVLSAIPKSDTFVLPEAARAYQRHSSYLTDRIQLHFRRCGIQTTSKNASGRTVVDVGFHSLRHSFISLCREANAPLAVVEAIVGHSSPAMTRHYSHVGEEAAVRAVNLLPSVMAEAELPDTKRSTRYDPLALADELRGLAGRLNAKTWREVGDALHAICRRLGTQGLPGDIGSLVCEPSKN